VEHRLPENHACPEQWRARAPGMEPPPGVEEAPPTPPAYWPPPAPSPAGRPALRFSPTELRHLALGTLLVMGVGMSIFRATGVGRPGVWVPGVLAAVFTSSFLLHEVAHKLAAQRQGLWAEFRLTLAGALITLVSILSPIKLISPGAVMVAGYGSRETIGRVSMAGPAANLLLSLLFSWTGLLLPGGSIILPITTIGGFFNAFIALFNLIPVGMLDGRKVLSWNMAAWGAAFALALILSMWTGFLYFVGLLR